MSWVAFEHKAGKPHIDARLMTVFNGKGYILSALPLKTVSN